MRRCIVCGKPFEPRAANQLSCSRPCARVRANQTTRANDKRGLTDEVRYLGDIDRRIVFRRRLHCHYCRGKHVSSECPNRDGDCIKQFGTLGPNREYVPPPGVKVRIMSIPSTVHGDTLKRMLKEDR